MPNKKKVCLVSLGCAKNLVDSEMVLAIFPLDRYELINRPSEADLIIINTCGFIGDAKKEAIDTILQMAEYKKKLVAIGCFVERNLDELKEAIPEVDLWIPLREYPSFHKFIGELLGDEDLLPLSPLRRIISTSSYSAYLRISDGCDNFCSFCAIPYIRGRLHSRDIDEILEEAENLYESGVKEISLVSQDPLHYGADTHKEGQDVINLLKRLDEVGFFSVRLLYLYPEEISEEELLFIKNSKSILPYFDIPIQSASNHVLKRMNRHGSKEDMLALFAHIKELFPNAVLRTTLIAGFPGETEEDHQETLEFIKEVEFDHLGCFSYSQEEGTASYSYPDQLDEKTKKRRTNEIMAAQKSITYKKNQSRVGEKMEGLVIGYDKIRDKYMLRSYWNAPDGIDGNIFFHSDIPLKEGDIVTVIIKEAYPYDLIGELVV